MMDRKAKHEAWKKTRARAGTREVVTVSIGHGSKNAGLRGRLVDTGREDRKAIEIEIDHEHCPCTICGHEYSWECAEESERTKGGCDCCSGTCT